MTEAQIIDLAAIRKAKAKAARKPRPSRKRRQPDPLQVEGEFFAYLCWQSALTAKAKDQQGVDLHAVARALIAGFADSLTGAVLVDPDCLLDQADATISLIVRWRAALHAAVTEAEEGDDHPDRAS